MSAATSLLPATSLIVTAHGQSAGGVPPHFTLLVDDVAVGDAAVAADTDTPYTFSVPIDVSVSHKVSVVYDNDGLSGGQDRNLFVSSISLGGQVIAASDPLVTYDKGAVDGRDVVAGQAGMYWAGALIFGVPAKSPPPPPTPPALILTPLIVTAHGQAAGGVPPHFTLLVDNVPVGDAKVAATTDTPYLFSAAIDPLVSHKVSVVYDNDGVSGGQDRNLFVASISIGGRVIAASDPLVSYDKGVVDGHDVIAGQAGMYWKGALIFGVPAANAQAFVPSAPQAPRLATGTAPTGPAYYVAPNGNDTWSGQLAAPNAAGTDGPFATPQRARDAMRAGAIHTTYLRGGTYTLTSTLALDQRDNGDAFHAYANETPVLSGGQTVTGFRADGNGVYSAPLASDPGLDVTIGGVRQHLAEKRNLDPAQPFTSDWYFANAAAGGASTTALRVQPGDIQASDVPVGGLIQVFDATRLHDAIVQVAGFDAASGTITLKTAVPVALGDGSTYKLLGNPAFVDAPGEFAWRASDQRLIVDTADGAALQAKGAVVARLGALIQLQGTSGVTLDGLTFANTTTDGDAVKLIGASNTQIGANHFLNVGTAIGLTQGSSNNLIGANTIEHTAVDGIDLTGASNANTIYDNAIEHVGEIRKFAAGILGSGANNNVLANNDIAYSPRYGISLKGYNAATLNTGNAILDNRVLATGQESADTGAIEMLGRTGTDTNTVIQGNWVEDPGGLASNGGVWQTNQKGFGVYLDDLTSGVDVSGNFFPKTSTAAVMIHGGDANTVHDNLSLLADNSQAFARVEWAPNFGDAGTPRDNTVDQNIVVGAVPLGSYLTLLSANNPVIDHNLLVNVGAFGPNDVVGSPGFTNPAAGDYSLAPGSTAAAMGIADLPWSQMGTSGWSARANMPIFWRK